MLELLVDIGQASKYILMSLLYDRFSLSFVDIRVTISHAPIGISLIGVDAKSHNIRFIMIGNAITVLVIIRQREASTIYPERESNVFIARTPLRKAADK